jgi:hypothetical protein
MRLWYMDNTALTASPVAAKKACGRGSHPKACALALLRIRHRLFDLCEIIAA